MNSGSVFGRRRTHLDRCANSLRRLDWLGAGSGRSSALVEAAKTIGAEADSNRGTLGGNVANASPAGDSLPVLLAHGGDVVLQSARRGRRKVALDSFSVPTRKSIWRPTSWLSGSSQSGTCRCNVVLPKGGDSAGSGDCKVVICGIGQLDGEGRIMALRLTAGAVAPVPMRLKNAEASALGKTPAEAASRTSCSRRRGRTYRRCPKQRRVSS